MLADAVNCTHNGTGGSGTITLASVSGYPQVTDVFGTSGTMFVVYQIAEYTDSTLVTLSKYEKGYGSIVLSTNVLTRTTPLKTWTSGGSYVKVGATALSFGNTAANVRITIGASSSSISTGLFKTNSGSSSVTGWFQFDGNTVEDTTVSTFTPVNGTTYYKLFRHEFDGDITSVAVDVVTGESSKILRMGIYDIDSSDGCPENLITEFTSGGTISLTNNSAVSSVTMGTKFWLPRGYYYLAIQADSSTATLRMYKQMNYSFMSGFSQRQTVFLSKTGTIGALPAAALTALTTTTKSGGENLPALYFK